MNKKFGWRGYIRDQRDDRFKLASPNMSSLPMRWSLAENCTRIEDQEQSSACTGYGSCYPAESWTSRMGADFVELSPYFIYWVGRYMSGLEDVDGGGYVRDVLKALTKFGVCQLGYWESDYSKINEKPSKEAFLDAETRKIESYHRCDSVEAICSALAQNLPVVWGFSCYESYDSEETYRTGVIQFPQSWERLRGGHCTSVYAYDRQKQVFRGPNSYSDKWGNKGWYEIPFRFFEEGLANEAFAIVR